MEVSKEYEIKIRPTSSTQVKLFASMKLQELPAFAETLKGMFGLADYDVQPENRKNVTDDYYDTRDLSLFKDHALLRVRRVGDSPKIIAKSMLSQTQGEFERSEFTQGTTEVELQSEILSNFQKMIDEAFPSLDGPVFEHVLKVTNERQNYLLIKGMEEFRLSLDLYFFTNPKTGRTSRQLFEVEVESLTSSASEKIGTLKGHLTRALGRFSYSHDSKFEAGVKKMRINRPNWQRIVFELGQSDGLNWVGVAIGFAGLIVGIVGTLATLRG